MRIDSLLITGGAGFIGSNFIRYAMRLNPNINIVNLDALTYAANPDNLSGVDKSRNYQFVRGTISDKKLMRSLFARNNFDAVVNFAAETHVDRSIYYPEDFIQTNIIGTFTLLEVVREYLEKGNGVDPEAFRFLHISTDEVYGSLSPDEPAFVESAIYVPSSPYSASKASADHMVGAYHRTYRLPVIVTNCSNNYGPYQFPEKLIPHMIVNAIQEKPLPIYGDGQQIRDWLYVEDHCEAIWLALNHGEIGETYNIGGGNQLPNLEVVKLICQILDNLSPRANGKLYADLIEFVVDRPGHDRRYAINFDKITKQLGWKPQETLMSGLNKTISWYLDNLNWVRKILNRKDYRSWTEKTQEREES